MLNIDKIRETFDNRNKSTEGITSVAFYCMETENWYDNLTQTINDKIKTKLTDIYQAYGCHRHITIMGLEELDNFYADEVSKLLSKFPKIKIKNAKFSLLENGLVVGEFYPFCDDGQQLELFRKSFEPFGVSYKHPQNIQKLHGVLGQLIPNEIEPLSIKDIENSINEILKDYKDVKIDDYIEKCDVKIVKYKTTSLNNIDSISLPSNEFGKLGDFFAPNGNTDIIDTFIKISNNTSNDELRELYAKLKNKIFQDKNLKDKLKDKITKFEKSAKEPPKDNKFVGSYKKSKDKYELDDDKYECKYLTNTILEMKNNAETIQNQEKCSCPTSLNQKYNKYKLIIQRRLGIHTFIAIDNESKFLKLEQTINNFSNPTPVYEKLDNILSKLKSSIYKCLGNSTIITLENESKLIEFLGIPDSTEWTDKLIFRFWRYIDLKILYESVTNSQEYKFGFFIFPDFIDSSFLALFDEYNIINTDKDIYFGLAHFSGKVELKKAVFNEKVNFNLARFYKKSKITQCFFLKVTYFRKTVFDNDIDFAATRFVDISLQDIQFPKNKLYKIKMERVTLEKAIWTEFNNPKNINQIEAGRETFSLFKQKNAEIGNFIDSNLFFARESEVYRLESKKNFLGNGQDGNHDMQWSVSPDVISFSIAKWTSNYGQSWLRPLVILVLIGLPSYFWSPNIDYVATPNTPAFALEENKDKSINALYKKSFLSNNEVNKTIFGRYIEKNYYDNYNFDFQDDSKMKLKDKFATRISFYLSCVIPTFLPVEQQYVIKSDSLWTYYGRLILNIVMWYLLAAFGFAIRNRTRRS